MRWTLCAGAIALAMIGLLSFASVSQAREFNSETEYGQQSASIDIARIKSALQLTPSQERYWGPVEAALRELGHRQAQTENEGLVRRISHRVVSIALNSQAIHKLAVAARPLINVLSEQQMQTAHGLAQEMGLGPVVAALR
ncbi:MAG TPA: hypothetical protein VEJ43_06130 [Pseudolabrys sp.]|nr:hypothetical protein [Pseudolabrys sp.]